MKKISSLLLSLFLVFALVACATRTKDFEQIEVDIQGIEDKMKDKESFAIILERENCSFCQSIQEYIEQTKDEHPGLVLYKVDTTDYELKREDEEAVTLVSNTKDGKKLLEMAPYFMYTPTIYIVKEGVIEKAGVGFDSLSKKISIAPLDAPIDFDTADTYDFWEFLES